MLLKLYVSASDLFCNLFLVGACVEMKSCYGNGIWPDASSKWLTSFVSFSSIHHVEFVEQVSAVLSFWLIDEILVLSPHRSNLGRSCFKWGNSFSHSFWYMIEKFSYSLPVQNLEQISSYQLQWNWNYSTWTIFLIYFSFFNHTFLFEGTLTVLYRTFVNQKSWRESWSDFTSYCNGTIMSKLTVIYRKLV